jgi:hypothetical protein
MEEDEKVKKNSYVNLERAKRHTVFFVTRAHRKLGIDTE